MFRYRLEPLLRYRKNLEEQQQRVLAVANRSHMANISFINEKERQRAKTMEWVSEMFKDQTDPEHLALYDNYMAGLELDIRKGKIHASQSLEAVNAERLKLGELVKKRRTIELHRDRLKERYEREEARKERVQSDEIALAVYSRFEREKEND